MGTGNDIQNRSHRCESEGYLQAACTGIVIISRCLPNISLFALSLSKDAVVVRQVHHERLDYPIFPYDRVLILERSDKSVPVYFIPKPFIKLMSFFFSAESADKPYYDLSPLPFSVTQVALQLPIFLRIYLLLQGSRVT